MGLVDFAVDHQEGNHPAEAQDYWEGKVVGCWNLEDLHREETVVHLRNKLIKVAEKLGSATHLGGRHQGGAFLAGAFR